MDILVSVQVTTPVASLASTDPAVISKPSAEPPVLFTVEVGEE